METTKYPLCKILLLIFILVPNIAKPQKELSIMSYNIHRGQDSDNNDKLEEMAELIIKSGADIVGLQEVDSFCFRSGQIDQAKKLAELTDMQVEFVRHFEYDGGAYGLALLSKFPISDIKNHRLPATGNKETVAFLTANVHVSSTLSLMVGVAHLDYRNANSRLTQANLIIDIYKDNNYPRILVGDINAEPGNKEISLLLDYFMDTQPEDFYTFPAEKPIKKIDYIFIDKSQEIKIIKKEVLNETYSDHLPILSTIVFE
jgi:endonuclease/exonuclease/phosphatase family metal-dependent hydrolase